MIEKLTEFPVNNRFMVILATLLTILIGSYSVFNTPLNVLPDLSDVHIIFEDDTNLY